VVCNKNGVPFGPMRSVLVVVKSFGFALRGFSEVHGIASLACAYLNCPDRAPVQVYGGGRLIGMRFVSVPTVVHTLSVMVSCNKPPSLKLQEVRGEPRNEVDHGRRYEMT
jgi:hypothetical protein